MEMTENGGPVQHLNTLRSDNDRGGVHEFRVERLINRSNPKSTQGLRPNGRVSKLEHIRDLDTHRIVDRLSP